MYAPASVTTNSVNHAQTLLHRKRALDQVLKKFQFHTVGQKDDMERQAGLTVQWHRYSVFAANTTAKATGTEATGQTTGNEGHIGAGLDLPSTTVRATLSQYSDFMTFSDIAVDTLIDNVVMAGAANLGYRAGLSVDTIIRNVIDNAATDLPLVGSNYTARDSAKAVHTLQANDVEPFSGGRYKIIASPFVTYDFRTDPAASGFSDLLKHTNPGAVSARQDRGLVGSIYGADIYESTNVFSTGTPTQYRVYTFGMGGIGIVSLSGRGPAFVTDPKRQRFNIRTIRNNGEIADPEGVIAAAVSYNFLFTAVNLDASTVRFRKTDATSTISS